MKLRAVFLICLGAILFVPLVHTQSLEELEAEVLKEKSNSESRSRPAPPPVGEEGDIDAQLTERSEDDLDADLGSTEPRFLSDEEKVKRGVDEKTYKEIDEVLTGPKSIPLKHIFVVKHQYIFKKNRHEIIPFSLGIQPGDSFRKQISMGMSYLYHLTESFSIEALHVNFMTNLATGFADDLSANAGLEVERVEPVLSLGAAFQWAPFRGKSATATNIYHFEGYLFLGGGMTQFEVGSSGMVMGGVGTRLFMNRRSTFKFELRDYFDFNEDVGNRLNIVIGAGILLGAASL